MDNSIPSRCLTTNEVVAFTGATRKQLDNYIGKQVVTPLHGSSASNKLWTAEQASFLQHIPALQRAGLSIANIAELADQGTQAVHQTLTNQYMRELRMHRRALKSLLYRTQETSDLACLGSTPEQYLRYIPQRWMALIPLLEDDAAPELSRFASSYLGLRGVAEVLGWCLTDSSGTLASLNADGRNGSYYLYAALASPPMPSYAPKIGRAHV